MNKLIAAVVLMCASLVHAGYEYGCFVPDFDEDGICRISKKIEMHQDPGWNDGGTLFASVGKTAANGKTSISFTYQLDGGQKTTVKYNGVMYDGSATFTYKGHDYWICFDWIPLLLQVEVDGDDNKCLQVYIDEKYNQTDSPEIPVLWQKARTLKGIAGNCCEEGNLGLCEVKCGKASKNGQASVSVVITPINGKKVTYRSQKVDVTGSTVTVDWTGFSLTIEGDSFSGVATDDCGLCVSSANVGGELTGTAYFSMGAIPETINGYDVLYPNCWAGGDYEPIAMAGKRWSLAKAAKMKWVKCPKNATCGPGDWNVDTSNGRTNISGLKLSYNPKTGFFKGSFTLFTWSPGGKKYTANVTGIMVDGIGEGVAVVKKPYTTWQISIDTAVPHGID